MLDQVAFGIAKDEYSDELIQEEVCDIEEAGDICLWRNEENLDEYMEEKFNRENPGDSYDQGKNVEITKEDIEKLRALIDSKEFTVRDMPNMMDCLDALSEVIDAGEYRVFYSASW